MAEPSIADVLMNNDLRLRRSDELFHSPQQTQEIKPLRLSDSQRRSFFDYINNPTRTEDPLKNLLAGVIGTDERMGLGDFIPGLSQALAERRGDKLGWWLSNLDYLPGGGIAPDMVTAMSAAFSKYQKKRADIIKRLKREQKIQETADATEMAGSVKEVNRLKKQLKKIDAAEAKRAAKFRIEGDYVPPPKKQSLDPTDPKLRKQLEDQIPTKDFVKSVYKAQPDPKGPINLNFSLPPKKPDEGVFSNAMLRDMQADYIKSRKGPTEIPRVIDDSRSLADQALDFDKAFLRGEYTTKGSNPTFNKPGYIQFTGKNFPDAGAYSDYSKYLNDPEKLKELKTATGSDLRYSNEIDPTLVKDWFSRENIYSSVPPPKGYTYKAPPEGALFRGDRSGLLERGKGFDITDTSDIVPSSGIYSLIDPTDPRFKMFAKGIPSKGGPGAGYVINPNFKNILDIDNIPPDFLKKLEDMDMFRNRPSRDLAGGIGDLMSKKRTDFQLDTILRGGPGSINKTPSGLSQDIADIFTKEGYDALRFPPRAMKGESDTIISLNPKNLEITDEIPYDQLDDFIRQLLSGK